MEKLREGSGDDQSMAFALSQLCLMGHLTLKKKNHKTGTGAFCTSVSQGLDQVPCSSALICQPLSEGFAIMEKRRH